MKTRVWVWTDPDKEFNCDWGRASPRYEFCAPSLDDFRQTIERGESFGPTTHTQMPSLEDSTIRIANGPNQRAHYFSQEENNCDHSFECALDRGLGRIGLG
jgi:hypothetical protein